MKNNYQLMLFLLILFFSCDNSKNDTVLSKYKIKEALDSPYRLLIDELIDSVWYVKLDSGEEALLGFGGNQYEFTDSFIYVLSDNSILQFGVNGTFKKKVSERGKGPKDIGFINKIIWNEDKKELYALDGLNSKILRYDADLENIGYIPCQGSGNLIAYNDNLYIGNIRDDFRNIGTKYAIDCINISVGKRKHLIKSRIQQIKATAPPMFSFGTYLYRYNDNVYIKEYRSDSVFRIKNDGLEFMYHLDIGDIKPAELDYPGDFTQRKISRNYISVHNIFETEKFIYLQVGYRYEQIFSMCSKKDKKVTCLINEKNNQYDGGTPITNLTPCQDGAYFVKEVWPETLLDEDFMEILKSSMVKNKISQNKLIEIIEQTSENDNPLLMFVKLKLEYE